MIPELVVSVNLFLIMLINMEFTCIKKNVQVQSLEQNAQTEWIRRLSMSLKKEVFSTVVLGACSSRSIATDLRPFATGR